MIIFSLPQPNVFILLFTYLYNQKAFTILHTYFNFRTSSYLTLEILWPRFVGTGRLINTTEQLRFADQQFHMFSQKVYLNSCFLRMYICAYYRPFPSCCLLETYVIFCSQHKRIVTFTTKYGMQLYEALIDNAVCNMYVQLSRL